MSLRGLVLTLEGADETYGVAAIQLNSPMPIRVHSSQC